MASRSEVLAHAAEHGDAAAAERYGIARTTVRVWRHRATHPRQPLPAAQTETPSSEAVSPPAFVGISAQKVSVRRTPAPTEPVSAAQDPSGPLPAWQPHCRRCGDAGWLERRGGRVRCPDCGDPQRIIVHEHPPDVWAEGMARFGDLTANLREREAAKLLAWRPPAPMPERGSQPRDPTRPQPAGPFSPARFLAEQQAEQTAAQRAREAAARTRAREAQGR